ncbi:MAG: PadR family transcriptional regulator [Acidobacteria bacterium]|nr:PadR family transcriptional regulator [Acidobacteriota bacterium]
MKKSQGNRTELLQGTLDMLILRVLAETPLHGYAIGKRLGEVSAGRLEIPQGSLYPALHRIEQRALVDATWTTIRGREAKVYAINAKGRRKLKDEISGWEELASTVSLVLNNA